MGYLIAAIIGFVLLFIFPGVIACLLEILGMIFNLTSFPIELLNFYIYPVGVSVYITLYVIFGYLIYEFIHHHLMNK